eukprot:GHVT01067304.1.p1 GENE.GHVT01067304.1~~GHVT01067304.1.p1  ORF type:complete len:140 (+),score=17.52 GHVT01067304.1:3-422(+)
MKSARGRLQPDANPIPSADSGPLSAAKSVGFDLRACDSVSLKDLEFGAHSLPNTSLSLVEPFYEATSCCAFLPEQKMETVFWGTCIVFVGCVALIFASVLAMAFSGLSSLQAVIYGGVTAAVFMFPAMCFAAYKVPKTS